MVYRYWHLNNFTHFLFRNNLLLSWLLSWLLNWLLSWLLEWLLSWLLEWLLNWLSRLVLSRLWDWLRGHIRERDEIKWLSWREQVIKIGGLIVLYRLILRELLRLNPIHGDVIIRVIDLCGYCWGLDILILSWDRVQGRIVVNRWLIDRCYRSLVVVLLLLLSDS